MPAQSPPHFAGAGACSNPTLAGLLPPLPSGQDHSGSFQVVPPPPPDGPNESSAQAPRSYPSRRNLRDPRDDARDIAQAREKIADAEKVRCHLHKKPKAGCKFCKKHQGLIDEAKGTLENNRHDASDDRRRRRTDRAISDERYDRGGMLEIANAKNGIGGLLQTHIVECAHYKSVLTLNTFDELIAETFQFANSVEPYMPNSPTLPSALFCCLYRFFTMGLDAGNLRRMLENQASPYIRCCGILFVRFGLSHDQLLGWLGDYLLDDEEFKPVSDADMKTTIGEFVEMTLSQDRYYNTVFPRLPVATKRRVEEELASVAQNRKRMQANKSIIGAFHDRGTKVECSLKGEWRVGTLIELEDDPPSRPKCRVRLYDGSEEYVHLGKVILADPSVRTRPRQRSRSRSRHDWSREKGRSDRELVEEMRSKERDKAVATGKDYARKPVGYKAACALPREQGAASYRLMEEETFVPINRGKNRSPSPIREANITGQRQSAERQSRMQQLFEKYSTQKGPDVPGRSDDGFDKPAVMRLG